MKIVCFYVGSFQFILFLSSKQLSCDISLINVFFFCIWKLFLTAQNCVLYASTSIPLLNGHFHVNN